MATIPILQQVRATPTYTDSRSFVPQANIGPTVAPAQIALPVTNIDRRAPQARDNAAAQARLTQQLMATDARQQSANEAAMQRALIDQETKKSQQAMTKGYYDGILENQKAQNKFRQDEFTAKQDAQNKKLANQEQAARLLLMAQGNLNALTSKIGVRANEILQGKIEAADQSAEEYLRDNPNAQENALKLARAEYDPELTAGQSYVNTAESIMKLGVDVGDLSMFMQPQVNSNQGGLDFSSLPSDKMEDEDDKSTNTGSDALNELNSEINEKREVLRKLLIEAGSKGAARQAEQEAERSPVQGLGRNILNFIEGPLSGVSTKESRTLEEAGLSRADAMSALGLRGQTDDIYTGYLGRGFYGVADPAVGLFKSGVDTAQDELLDLDNRIKILQDALGRE